MKIKGFVAVLSLLSASTACTAERAVLPQPATEGSFVSSIAPAAAQVPLLFVVDGVRYARDQVPSLTAGQVAHVRVLKGHVALKEYGPDASYGVVVITTRQGVAPRS